MVPALDGCEPLRSDAGADAAANAPATDGEQTSSPTALARQEALDLLRTGSQVASANWQSLRKELSVGLELECFLPDLGALTPDRLTPVESKEGLFRLVASKLTDRLQELHGVGPKCRAVHQVSSDARDWGSLWTVTEDGSIKPELSCGSANPFPVELVSRRMRLDDVDVTLFCDMVHTLSSAPFCGKANESTGLHVHIGKHPEFFTFPELTRILKAYVRYEGVINSLLPISRQKNPFCIDFREQLASVGGLGANVSEDIVLKHICLAEERVNSLTPARRAALCSGLGGLVSKEDLLPVLFGEGLVWSSKKEFLLSVKSGDKPSIWVPPGMVLRELKLGNKMLWQEPSSEQLVATWDAGNDTPASPWDVLGALPDDVELTCSFSLPKEVAVDRMDFWLFRNALGLVGRKTDRYCKLNLMRIHLPSERATIEFRQFPGGNFNRALTIWGWVKFLGHFISQCIAGPPDVLLRAGPASETELKSFMKLSNDTLLLAWYRDTLVQQPRYEAVIESMRSQWVSLWSEWRAAAAVPGSGKSLVDAVACWRRVYWAAAGMKQLFPSQDAVWLELSTSKQDVEKFMQRLYQALAERLTAYAEQLSAVEEVSRCTSLATVVKLAVELASVQPAKEEIRLLQAGIQETAGWKSCSPDLLQHIAEKGSLAAELLLDHIRNLLNLCERSAKELRDQRSSATAATQSNEKSVPILDLQDPSALEVKGLAKRDASAAIGAIQSAKRHQGKEVYVKKLYQELCGILAPRAEEVQGLWQGLRNRSWTPERVDSLNDCLFR
eukprot:TRINITY_DN26537_c0_g5_i1.p1 TRINITY_DN26537_c0_g5~~TRINITY_DN26537_c0_g5_i1.p1  ORF type:complete len:784 (-),score=112.14 TRINITY_DN26537_c0_g5_i1:19-2370(-)